MEQLATLQADILITHEAPGYHEHGFKALDTLARRMGVRMTVHGHQHDCIDNSARWAEQGFESYGVGLREVMAWPIGHLSEHAIDGEASEKLTLDENVNNF